MAVNTVDLSFVKMFEREVHYNYQQNGSLLRGTVRTKNKVMGSETHFQKIGRGKAVSKARNAEIPPMNLSHESVACVLEDHYAGDYVDQFDELKTQHEERNAVTQSGAWALGRVTDDLIIKAAEASTQIATGTGSIDKARILTGIEMLNAKDVPNDGKRYGLLTPRQWAHAIHSIPEFSSADFVDDRPFINGAEPRRWLGVTWFMHTGITGATTDSSNVLVYHHNAIGHAIGADVTADVQWVAPRAAWWVANSMSQGACLIDQDGVVKIAVDDNEALT